MLRIAQLRMAARVICGWSFLRPPEINAPLAEIPSSPSLDLRWTTRRRSRINENGSPDAGKCRQAPNGQIGIAVEDIAQYRMPLKVKLTKTKYPLPGKRDRGS